VHEVGVGEPAVDIRECLGLLIFWFLTEGNVEIPGKGGD